MSRLRVVPEPPSGDADGHDDADDHLSEENEEEEEKVEGTVTPRRRKKQPLEELGSIGKGHPECVISLFCFVFFK